MNLPKIIYRFIGPAAPQWSFSLTTNCRDTAAPFCVSPQFPTKSPKALSQCINTLRKGKACKDLVGGGISLKEYKVVCGYPVGREKPIVERRKRSVMTKGDLVGVGIQGMRSRTQDISCSFIKRITTFS